MCMGTVVTAGTSAIGGNGSKIAYFSHSAGVHSPPLPTNAAYLRSTLRNSAKTLQHVMSGSP